MDSQANQIMPAVRDMGGGYVKFKSGPRKGRDNYDKPQYLSGIAFNEGFVTISGHGDCCVSCLRAEEIVKKLVDKIMNEDLKIEIRARGEGIATRYLRDDERICHKCGESMYESEMSRSRTMMGDGTYPSGCPKCKASSGAFGPMHKVTGNFRMIEAPPMAGEGKHE